MYVINLKDVIWFFVVLIMIAFFGLLIEGLLTGGETTEVKVENRKEKITMKKVFISVGMSGRNEIDVRNDIKRASENIRKLYGEEVEIVHNYDCVAPEGSGRLYYLGEAIKQLGDCDVCYFVRNWALSDGCVAERHVCGLYSIDTILESDDRDGVVKLGNGIWWDIKRRMIV